MPRGLAHAIFDRDGGRCYHCKCVLKKEVRSSYHIDHFPVPYRDVESQICCGTIDVLDENNLVLSCPPCNLSHAHEQSYARYCGHSQFPCKRWFWRRVGIFFLFLGSNVLTGTIVYISR